ncbi:MAG: hypothetical protein KAI97_07100, partial [Gemmatimonadetes bacterium]|nr:hypothetical protein [Gemmatimonadota bacterium]
GGDGGGDGEEDNSDADFANDRIEVGANGDGVYLFVAQISFSGTANATFTFAASVNGTPATGVLCQRKLGTGGDVGSASLVGLLSLADGDLVTLEAKADAASKTLTITEGSVSIARLG